MICIYASVYHTGEKIQEHSYVKNTAAFCSGVQQTQLRTKMMPRVPGPQWQDTVQPAVVSMMESNLP